MSYICWFWLLKCEDLQLFCVLYVGDLNIFRFWDVGRPKQTFRGRHLGFQNDDGHFFFFFTIFRNCTDKMINLLIKKIIDRSINIENNWLLICWSHTNLWIGLSQANRQICDQHQHVISKCLVGLLTQRFYPIIRIVNLLNFSLLTNYSLTYHFSP